MKIFSADYLDELTERAKLSSRLRQHRNIHEDYQDPCQRLFNAIEPGSYIRPHRHSAVPRDELLMAVRGLMAMVTFDDHGEIVDVFHFGSGGREGCVAAGLEVPSSTWHTVVALEPGSVLFEVKAGPFDPAHPKEFAPWAPEEGGERVAVYIQELLARIQCQ